jgi:hypothetical protein
VSGRARRGCAGSRWRAGGGARDRALHEAADASGLLTTAIQLSQAVGMAAFGSLFLTLDAGGAGLGAYPPSRGMRCS